MTSKAVEPMAHTKITPSEALDLEFFNEDAGCATIRGYFQNLLLALFDEGEGFSGKRPFGNSGWEHDLAVPLVKAGAVKGTVYDDNKGLNPDDEFYIDDPDEIAEYCDDYDRMSYDTFVFKMIAAL